MAMNKKKDIVYKDRLSYFLRIILEIAGHDTRYSRNQEVDYMKRLKFQKQTDWKRYRASTDLFEDTESAIIEAFKYQLGRLDRRNDFGERYLRLYGILNAVYLQIGALNSIANLLNFPSIENAMSEFRALPIYKLRNIAGAHTVNYSYEPEEAREKGIHQKSSFRIIQYTLEETGRNIEALDENGIWHKFNLLEILKEYERMSFKFIVQLILHMTRTLIYDKEQRNQLIKDLDDMILNIADYSNLDKNEKIQKRHRKRLEKMITMFGEEIKDTNSIQRLFEEETKRLDYSHLLPKFPDNATSH
jgi:hypothetical protein